MLFEDDSHQDCREEIERLQAWNREARAWLAQCLGFVTGEGPPSWDGIRAFLKIQDQQEVK